MPRRRGYGSYKRRKPYFRRFRGRTRRRFRGRNMKRASLVRIRNGYAPESVFVKLKFSEVRQQQPMAVSEGFVYAGSAMLDPNQALSGGDQPIGYEEWFQFYSRYQVFGSKIHFTCANQNTVTGMYFVWFPSTNSTQAADYESALDIPYAKRLSIGALTSGRSVQEATTYISYKKIRGAFTQDITMEGIELADPTREFFWVCQALSHNQAALLNYSFEVRITYYVKFFERRTLQQSFPTLRLKWKLPVIKKEEEKKDDSMDSDKGKPSGKLPLVRHNAEVHHVQHASLKESIEID